MRREAAICRNNVFVAVMKGDVREVHEWLVTCSNELSYRPTSRTGWILTNDLVNDYK